ncbi:hypothetical protein ECEC1848_2281, partial [Escherichia coli EC1848]
MELKKLMEHISIIP